VTYTLSLGGLLGCAIFASRDVTRVTIGRDQIFFLSIIKTIKKSTRQGPPKERVAGIKGDISHRKVLFAANGEPIKIFNS
jgi:hypothetical protein